MGDLRSEVGELLVVGGPGVVHRAQVDLVGAPGGWREDERD